MGQICLLLVFIAQHVNVILIAALYNEKINF